MKYWEVCVRYVRCVLVMCELCMKYWEVYVRYVRYVLVMCEVLGGVCEVCEVCVSYV